MRGLTRWGAITADKRLKAPVLAALAAALVAAGANAVGQSPQGPEGFTVYPVTIEMQPGQRTAIVTLQNHSRQDAAFQVRPFAWDQPGGAEQLQPTDQLVASPPLGLLPVGSSQVIRLVLRQPAEARETAYRIWLDQIPPAAAPGAIGFALRLSIPIFIEPSGHIAPQVHWRAEVAGQSVYLVAVNDGSRREVVHELAVHASAGGGLALESGVSPYVLAGATRRWRIIPQRAAPVPGETLRLTAEADTGPIDQAVPVVRAGP